MAKPASELTLAIRSLCEDTDGAITHAQARPRLKKLGLKVVRDPGRQSAEHALWEEYEVDYDDAESIQSTADACGFDGETTKAVLREHDARLAFKKERNNFDVTKNLWKNAKASGKPSPSRKPTASKNRRAAAASQPEPARPRGSAPQVARPTVLQTGEEMEAVQFVEANGGLAAVEKMLIEARQNVTDLEGVVSAFEALTKRITAAA